MPPFAYQSSQPAFWWIRPCAIVPSRKTRCPLRETIPTKLRLATKIQMSNDPTASDPMVNGQMVNGQMASVPMPIDLTAKDQGCCKDPGKEEGGREALEGEIVRAKTA